MSDERFTPEQLEQVVAAMGGASAGTRTPLKPRQLSDLRLLPTATDARPMFLPSAELPRDQQQPYRYIEYPKLMWHGETGTEITVYSATEEARMQDEYVTKAPAVTPQSAVEAVQDELAGLSPEDRALVIEAQRQARLTRLHERLAGLSEADLEQALGTVASTEKPARSKPRKVAS